MLCPNCVIAKDVESLPTAINSTSRVNALAPNRYNSLPCKVRTSKLSSSNKRVGCLLCSMARIYNLWEGTLDQRKVRGLVPCCG